HAVRHRREVRSHPRGGRAGLRGHPRANPPDRGQGAAQAPPPLAVQAPQGLRGELTGGAGWSSEIVAAGPGRRRGRTGLAGLVLLVVVVLTVGASVVGGIVGATGRIGVAASREPSLAAGAPEGGAVA